ncbi:ABC transporter permease subunit [Dactylosporangium sp. CA-092794]|uniref:branched-chain amino acid ABC transporter permease n=1 Tax=Dactylosporangium sp. CA-092794 TaxID=3239929 RepID=UPI003D915075
MSTYLQILIFSLGAGAIYAALANGLILVFRATGIINFAMGATAMWGGYVYFTMRTDGRLVLPIASIDFGSPQNLTAGLAAALLSAVLMAVLIFYLAFRPVRNAPVLAQVVVSIAVMLSLTALVNIRFGAAPINGFTFGRIAVVHSKTVTIFGKVVTVSNVTVAAVVVALSALLWAYLRFTRIGIATRAASGNERAAMLMGYAPNRLALVAMVISSLLGTLGVILVSPILGLSSTVYSLYVVQALAVMLVARMTSLPVATVAGFGLGFVQQLLVNWTSDPWWPSWGKAGLDQLLPLVIVIVALLVHGNRLPARGSLQTMRLPDVKVPSSRPVGGVVTFAVIALVIVFTGGQWRFGITMSLIFGLMALSFVVITGYLGQLSLAQLAFAGTAGLLLSKLHLGSHTPFFLTILVCALGATALSVLVAIPALRIRGVQLAIATLAAALAIARFVFTNNAFTPPQGLLVSPADLFGLSLPRQVGFDVSRLSFSLMVLVVVALMVVVFVRIASGDLGRAFLAVRANERAAASAGIDVRLVKLVGFALSAFFAGVAGCLLGYATGLISGGSYDLFAGLSILAVAYVGGITSWHGALIAGASAPLGIVYTIIQHFWSVGDYYSLIAGLLLILTAVLNPSGIADALPAQLEYLRRRTRTGQARSPDGSRSHHPLAPLAALPKSGTDG